jgi:hypothetical protein
MAKDAKGHGSETRGGSAVRAPAYDGKPTWHGVTASGQKVTNRFGNPIAYASPEAAVNGTKLIMSVAQSADKFLAGGGQPVVSDAHAAAALASGPKSAPVDVHPAQVGQMKMSPGDFAKLSAAVTPHLASTADPSHSPTRQRWDAMHKSGFDTNPLYKAGLNDAHIDTALRRIQGK